MALLHITTIQWYGEYHTLPIDTEYFFTRNYKSRFNKYINYLENSEYYFEDKCIDYMAEEREKAMKDYDLIKVIEIQNKQKEKYEGNAFPSLSIIVSNHNDKGEHFIKHYYRPGYLENTDKGMELIEMLKKDKKFDNDLSDFIRDIICLLPVAITIFLFFFAPVWGIVMLVIDFILYLLTIPLNQNTD